MVVTGVTGTREESPPRRGRKIPPEARNPIPHGRPSASGTPARSILRRRPDSKSCLRSPAKRLLATVQRGCPRSGMLTVFTMRRSSSPPKSGAGLRTRPTVRQQARKTNSSPESCEAQSDCQGDSSGTGTAALCPAVLECYNRRTPRGIDRRTHAYCCQRGPRGGSRKRIRERYRHREATFTRRITGCFACPATRPDSHPVPEMPRLRLDYPRIPWPGRFDSF